MCRVDYVDKIIISFLYQMFRKSRGKTRSKRPRTHRRRTKRQIKKSPLLFKQQVADKVAGATGTQSQFVLNRIENGLELVSRLVNKFYKYKEIVGVFVFISGLVFCLWYFGFIPYENMEKVKMFLLRLFTPPEQSAMPEPSAPPESPGMKEPSAPPEPEHTTQPKAKYTYTDGQSIVKKNDGGVKVVASRPGALAETVENSGATVAPKIFHPDFAQSRK